MSHRNTIVLIDDDIELSELIRIKLSHAYDIKCFSNATEAQSYIYKNDISCVIVDYYLKNMSGLLIAWDLIDNFPMTPILLVSSDPEAKKQMDQLNFRHVRFLLKPFSIDELSFAIKILIDKNSSIHLQQVSEF